MAKITNAANPAPILTPENLKQAIAEAVAAAVGERDKAKRSDGIEQATIRAFRRAGYGEVKPRQDVKIYHLWITEGRKVREGEKSVRCRNLRLFHVSQTEPLAPKEQAKLLAERDARKAAKSSASKLPPVTPIAA